MKCPFCSKDNTRVIDSRPADDNNSIRRRRQCDECQRRFTTYEKVETIPLVVIKKDLLEQARTDIPAYLRYNEHAEADSLYNTPPTFSVWIANLTFKWIKSIGGMSEIG